jgi:sporulation protein YqfC
MGTVTNMKPKRDDSSRAKRMSMLQRLGQKLDIPADVLSGIHIELRGRNNLTVRGCRKILHYTETEVRVRLSGQTLQICGSSLYCTAYHRGVVEIDGIIDSLCFIGQSGRAK